MYHSTIHAQSLIKGEIRSEETDSLLDNVIIRNTYSKRGTITDSTGKFLLEVHKGDLIHIRRLGYEEVRIRINNEKEPSFYKLILKRKSRLLPEVDIRGQNLDFAADSIRYRETYGWVLNKPGQYDLDMQSMPLAMLSKRNREEWAFQQMYQEWSEEKFIDLTFNKVLVQKITYLKGEDLDIFMKQYRPTYYFLRHASRYEFLLYIKQSYHQFRNQSE